MRLSSNWLFYAIISSIFTLPLIFSPYLPNVYEYPKFLTFLFICGIVQILLFMWLFRHPTIFPKTKLAFCIRGYISVVFLANVFGIDPRVSLLGSTWRHQGFLLLLSCCFLFFFLSIFMAIHKKDIEKLNRYVSFCIFLTVTLLCGFALIQWVLHQLFPVMPMPLYQGRIVGTMGNPNVLAGYLLMLFPLLLFAFPKTAQAIKLPIVIMKCLLTCAIILTIFVTDSRSGYIAAAVLFMCTLFYFFHKHSTRKKFFLFLGAMSICCIGILWFATQAQVQLRRTSMWDNREIIWQGGIDAFVQRPLLGYGQENFELVFTKVRFWKVDNAHNIFLETAIASGAVGLAFFLSIIGLAWYKATIAVRLSLIAFLMTAQFNPLAIPQIVLFWVLLAFADQKPHGKKEKDSFSE